MGKKSLNLALGLALLASLVLGLPAEADSAAPIRLLIDGQLQQLPSQPAMIGGRVYVPARALLAALGAQVTEARELGTVKLTASRQDITLEIRGNSQTALVNGASSDLGSPPQMMGHSLYVPVRWLGETVGAKVEWFSAARIVALTLKEEEALPRIGSFDHLQALVGEAAGRGGSAFYRYSVTGEPAAGAMIDALPTAFSATTSAEAKSAGAADFSQTNVQVEGVDEADLVKTDGTHLYQVNGNRVIITRAVPADAMEVVATIPFHNEFRPLELYAEKGRLVVIGQSAKRDARILPIQPMEEETGSSMKTMIYPPVQPVVHATTAYVYDTADIGAPKLVRELELEGDYLSSRKIGDNLYLITNKWLDVYRIMRPEAQPDLAVPVTRDARIAAEGGKKEDAKDGNPNGNRDELIPIPYDRIRYFPDFIEPNYLVIGAVDLADSAAMDVQAYLGSGQNVYASTDHLYIAVTRHDKPQTTDADGTVNRKPVIGLSRTSTDIYKFALLPGKVEYRAQGNVPGTILNQFSMDEYDGHFRIATTTGSMWGEGDNQWKNHLYILDESLKPVGQVTDIAPDERIYAVRFVGKRAYMVTFRTVDPLFAIDVSDPASPKVLGALKIPGYSDYLHPYDENHLIGFGKDTVEMSWKDENGNVVGTNAYYLGMKVALFDVTDVTNPIEKHVAYIGDRGTHSDLLNNHKALLFSREKNLLAFPVDLYEVQESARNRELSPHTPDYGSFTFQGAYVYSVDPDNGFQLRGRITHLDEDELLKAGRSWHYGDRFVRRILYIGDALYTLSDAMIKANDMNDLGDIGTLHLPEHP